MDDAVAQSAVIITVCGTAAIMAISAIRRHAGGRPGRGRCGQGRMAANFKAIRLAVHGRAGCPAPGGPPRIPNPAICIGPVAISAITGCVYGRCPTKGTT